MVELANLRTDVRITSNRDGTVNIDLEDLSVDDVVEALNDNSGILDAIGKEAAIRHFGIEEAE